MVFLIVTVNLLKKDSVTFFYRPYVNNIDILEHYYYY